MLETWHQHRHHRGRRNVHHLQKCSTRSITTAIRRKCAAAADRATRSLVLGLEATAGTERRTPARDLAPEAAALPKRRRRATGRALVPEHPRNATRGREAAPNLANAATKRAAIATNIINEIERRRTEKTDPDRDPGTENATENEIDLNRVTAKVSQARLGTKEKTERGRRGKGRGPKIATDLSPLFFEFDYNQTRYSFVIYS